MAETMDYPVVMPKLGLTMMQALLVEWGAKEGEYINKGDILFTMESEKSTLEIEAPVSGYVHILVNAGETVAINTRVCVISPQPVTGGGKVSIKEDDTQAMTVGQSEINNIKLRETNKLTGQSTGKTAASPRARLLARELGIKLEQFVGTGPRDMIVVADVQRAGIQKTSDRVIKATPVARRLAKESGVDLQSIKGTGVHGEVTKEDIEKTLDAESKTTYVESMEPLKAAVPLSGLRAVIIERLSSSWRERPHVTLTTEVNAEQLLSARRQMMDETGKKVSYNSFFIFTAARALKENQHVNVSLDEDGIIQHDAINIGLAVDTDRGLLVPVIREADQKGIIEIESAIQTLTERALAGKSLPDDLSGGTFTITNLGAYGIEAFTPIINPPETAILGIGAIIPKAVVINDQITVQNRLMLSLSHDHRILDGAPAARFLQRIAELISRPLVLFAL